MQTLLKNSARRVADRIGRLGVREFEIYIESKKGTLLEIKNSEREVFEKKSGLAFAVRFIKDHHMAFAYGTDFGQAAIDAVLHTAKDSLPYQSNNKNHAFAQPAELPHAPPLQDPKFDRVSLKDKMDILLRMEKSALAHDRRIAGVKYVSLDDECESVLVHNSHGLERFQQRTVFCTSIGVQAQAEGEEEIAYEIASRVFFDQLPAELAARSAAGHCVELLGGKPLPNYRGPAVLSREVVTELLEVLAPGFFGDSVVKRQSFLAGKLGKKMYASAVNIVDDGLLPGGMGSGFFDAEGTPRQTTVLVNKGVVRSFLYDEFWGRRARAASTGNSERADVTARPQVGLSNFFVREGDADFEHLLQSLRNGVLITDVIGMHNADDSSGSFSVGVQGLVVRNGRKERAFRSNVWTGNVHQVMAQVSAVGKDLKFYGGLGAPSILIADVEISGS